MHDTCCADFPSRRAVAVILTNRTGRINGAVRNRKSPFAALARICSKPASLSQKCGETLKCAVPEISGQLDLIGKGDISVLVLKADVTGSGDLVGTFVIGDLIGDQGSVVARNLDMTLRRDQGIFGIVSDLIGLQEKLFGGCNLGSCSSGDDGKSRQCHPAQP